MSSYIPEKIETEAPLYEIYKIYSKGERYGKFSITNFRVEQAENKRFAFISFENLTRLHGGGATLRYEVKNGEVAYLKSDLEIEK